MSQKQNFDYETVTISSLIQVLTQNDQYFTPRQNTYSRRLVKWVDFEEETFSFTDYFRHLASLQLTSYRTELRFLFDLCRLLGIDQNPILEGHFLHLHPSQQTRPNRLLTLPEIRQALSKLTTEEQPAIHFLALSGRRQIDISRLTSCPDLDEPLRFFGNLPYSKCSATMSLVEFNYQESEFTTLSEFNHLRELLVQGYCQTINWSRIHRKTKVSLHKLRNRKTLDLLMRGYSDSAICHRLGWRTNSSLQRYSFLTPSVVQNFRDIDQLVGFVRLHNDGEDGDDNDDHDDNEDLGQCS